MKPKVKANLLSLLLTTFLSSGVTAMAAPDWGKENTGLQMSLGGSSRSDMIVTVRNTSKQDKMLIIGKMLAPTIISVQKGKDVELPQSQYQFPDLVSLLIEDTAGKTREFVLKGPPGVAGTLEPLEVPLPAGAQYTLMAPLSEYIDGKTFAPPPKGSVHVTAKYTSKSSANRVNRKYWSGSLISNTISIKL